MCCRSSQSPADVTRHLREYFAAAGDRVPGWIRFGLRLLPSRRSARPSAGRRRPRLGPTAGPQIHRRVEPEGSPGGGRPDAPAVAGLHGRSARRGDDHREGGRRIARRVPRIDRRPEPRGQRLAGRRPHRPRRPRPAAARQRVGQAVGALQPVRRHRPRRRRARRGRTAAADPPRRPRTPGVRQHRHGAVCRQGSDSITSFKRCWRRPSSATGRTWGSPCRPICATPQATWDGWPTGRGGAGRRCGCGW